MFLYLWNLLIPYILIFLIYFNTLKIIIGIKPTPGDHESKVRKVGSITWEPSFTVPNKHLYILAPGPYGTLFAPILWSGAENALYYAIWKKNLLYLIQI